MVCLDTDVLVAILRQKREAVEFLNSLGRDEALSTTIVSACELFEGTYYANNPEKSMNDVTDLLGRLNVLHTSASSALGFGKIASSLKLSGNPLEDFDILIAAIALDHGENAIVTRNVKHFGRIPGLKVVRW